MGFLLKKFISFWLMPLPFCLTLLTIGVILLLFSKRQRLGRGLVAVGALLLLLFSNKAVSRALIFPLENLYPPVPPLLSGEPLPPAIAECRYIVVLGGGHSHAPGFSAVNQLSTSARGRLMEALRIARALPDAKLVFSGHAGEGRRSHAAVLADAALSLGLDPARIAVLNTPRDTEDEAEATARLVGEDRFVLVTSAWHMRRAMALMRGRSLNPVPGPADYTTRLRGGSKFSDYTWDTESLGRSTWAVYERIGYVWVWLRGKV